MATTIRYFGYVEKFIHGHHAGSIESACIAKFDTKYLEPIDREDLLNWEASSKKGHNVHLLNSVIITESFFAIDDMMGVLFQILQN